EDNPIFKRGNELRQERLNRPAPTPFTPPTFTQTTIEEALQAGWIARGPNNRIIAGPGDVLAQRGPDGKIRTVQSQTTHPSRPSPRALIAFDQDTHSRRVKNEYLTIFRNSFMLIDFQDGKTPPLEFRAQNMVTFSPTPQSQAPAKADPTAPPNRISEAFEQASKVVTGVYLEGDVSFQSGDHHVRASRIYVDLIAQRAIMLDATFSTVDTVRNVPLYMRAEQIRMLSRSEFAAKKATFSTSEFHTPHYSLGAGNIYLQSLAGIDETADNRSFAFKVKDATINIAGVPVFYWPYFAADTSKNDIPLRKIHVGNSRTYGLSLRTNWDIFGLAGQPEPKDIRADLYLDYFGKRGPATGINAQWETDDNRGEFRSYILADHGKDNLGKNRENIPVEDDVRGRASFRHMQDLGDGLTLAVEAAYVSDPNFLQQFFGTEFDTEKEFETSVYLKKQGENDALTFLGKFSLFDFAATADQLDDQFQTEKRPEIKYWRIGDSFFDTLTYYSESSVSYLHTNITNYTPRQLAFAPSFLGQPARVVPLGQTFKQFYLQNGFTNRNVLRADTRHEINMPLQIGNIKVTPYAVGRITAWDETFAQPGVGDFPAADAADHVRFWGQVGLRSSLAFWRTYREINSTFWDLRGIRHIIEPQFTIFATGSNIQRGSLQPFDRDVEGISRASGMSFAIHQKWQTKRGGEGHWRDVDWLVLNVQINHYWNADDATFLYPLDPLRGYNFFSRPELSLIRNSVAIDAVWRIGERARLVGEYNINTDTGTLEQFATGLVVDQTDNFSYFFGNRFINALSTNEWTIAVDYRLSNKYQIIAAESYDTSNRGNILSALTLVRRFPRFNTGLTITYDANQADTIVTFAAWPEGFPEMGFGRRGENK
ncbi:MAG: LPS assembly protein LptD, partial [Phycisphaerales bacterium]|nr:LPS assembly protein LptD [Phycisphaerales bacterium]